ncbi:hypothetical protein CH063_09500 [Colletotrichum higginsianum]|uniref:Uncharacterized protein n=1 Tax=Colletotrichum higginsianum (strain IMI 349063) TaxID=759273 RepID=H1VDV2_COLHI|nr:hypothetical protein CH063_09500 [Colletotrichum higginsianum]
MSSLDTIVLFARSRIFAWDMEVPQSPPDWVVVNNVATVSQLGLDVGGCGREGLRLFLGRFVNSVND